MTPLNRPNLVSRLALPYKFLKKNNKRKDQMQKEKQLYTIVEKKLIMYSGSNSIYSLKVGKGREKFLPWCQLIICIGGNLRNKCIFQNRLTVQSQSVAISK